MELPVKSKLILVVVISLLISGCSPSDLPTPDVSSPSETENNTPPEASETVSQSNAVKKGEQYLSFTAFSRSGLIEQLEFDGFNKSDATYGTDAQNANWNEQAAKKAKAYLSFTAFSRSGLIDQLKFDGFSQKEAEYGVNANGF
jgi:cytoplasmic iron level regulating protein YaaA (DUF328/UPF0246 family)